MRKAWQAVVVAATLLAGCKNPAPPPEPPYSYFHAPQFQWAGVGRVLIMPFDNETAFPHAPDEVRNALATELQRLGLFEVVPAPPQLPTEVSRVIRENGRFNEVALVQLARLFRADLIVMGTVTQYNPYASLPRLGLVLQVVSPGDGVVVASVDGMWDAASAPVAQRAQAFYRQYTKPSEVPFTAALVLESPRLFQRFVCFEAAQVLVPPPPRPPAPVVPAAALAPAPAPVQEPPLLPPPIPGPPIRDEPTTDGPVRR